MTGLRMPSTSTPTKWLRSASVTGTPKIISRYQKSILNCKRVATIADRVYVYDNSVDDAEARLLFRMTDGQLFKQYTNDIPEWATMILHSELPNENNED